MMKVTKWMSVLLMVLMSGSVLAGGDQNCNQHRGDKGQGSVVQNQVRYTVPQGPKTEDPGPGEAEPTMMEEAQQEELETLLGGQF